MIRKRSIWTAIFLKRVLEKKMADISLFINLGHIAWMLRKTRAPCTKIRTGGMFKVDDDHYHTNWSLFVRPA